MVCVRSVRDAASWDTKRSGGMRLAPVPQTRKGYHTGLGWASGLLGREGHVRPLSAACEGVDTARARRLGWRRVNQ